MKILGIETSCDETACAVLDIEKDKITVFSSVVSSQVKIHRKFGGVVPHLAAREHEKNLPRVLKMALKKAEIKNIKKDIALIAVTRGPGLAPALWRGVNFAKELAKKETKPLVGVNHLEGHIYSNWLKPIGIKSEIKYGFPALNLIVSGGHTMLVLMKDYGNYKLLGETRDDAAGEAFDKIARLLNLGYPGGPAIAQRVVKFKVKSLKLKVLKIIFPRPMINSKDYDFSFSGLKTSVLYKVRDFKNQKIKLTKNLINQICHEAQQAIIDVLIKKTIDAAKEFKAKSIMLSGGVSANKELRSQLEIAVKKIGVPYFKPELQYTTDNAAMIALAGYFSWLKNKKTDKESAIDVDANLGF